MAVVVRRAVFEDAPVIGKYAQKLVEQHEDYDQQRFARLASQDQKAAFYASQTNSEESAVLVAELDGEVVGFAFVQFELKDYAGLIESAAWLHDIYVTEAARGFEVGKKLLEAAVIAAKEFGASKLMLSVAVQNEKARRIFERAGYRTTMFEMMLDLTN